jgi:acyl-coenzyme A synthetase/AMP-(fatty) acid ligase
MFMLPGHVEIATELPRNPNGKIDRKALSSQFARVFTGSEEPA